MVDLGLIHRRAINVEHHQLVESAPHEIHNRADQRHPRGRDEQIDLVATLGQGGAEQLFVVFRPLIAGGRFRQAHLSGQLALQNFAAHFSHDVLDVDRLLCRFAGAIPIHS